MKRVAAVLLVFTFFGIGCTSAKMKESADQDANADAPTSANESITTAPKLPLTLLKYVPHDVPAVAGIQPLRVIRSAIVREPCKAANQPDVLTEALNEAFERLGLRFNQIDEIVVVFDEQSVKQLPDLAHRRAMEQEPKQILKRVAQGMLKFEKTNHRFPSSENDGVQRHTGKLSWRVHLLPYLGEAELYGQFHLDEDWDSDHNKTLIDKMPSLFRSEGISTPGQTSIHVIVGEGTLFGRDRRVVTGLVRNPWPTVSEVSDGTSCTIMAVIAGADKADLWTKPGGLPLDIKTPIQSLGQVGESVAIALLNGDTHLIPANIDPEDLLHLIMHQDGHALKYSFRAASSMVSFLPGIAIHSISPIDQITFRGKLWPNQMDSQSDPIGGLEAMTLYGTSVVFPDPNTVLIGTKTTIQAMLRPQSEPNPIKTRFEQLHPINDLVFVASSNVLNNQLGTLIQDLIMMTNTESLLQPILDQASGSSIAEIVNGLRDISLNIDLTNLDQPLLKANCGVAAPEHAKPVVAFLSALYSLNETLRTHLSTHNQPRLADLTKILMQPFSSAITNFAGNNAIIEMAKPSQFAKFHQLEQPVIQKTPSRLGGELTEAQLAQSIQNLHTVGAALMWTHPTFANPQLGPGMDRYDESTNPHLSWRVYCLQFLGQTELFNQFHLDEPWDSKHNKPLVARMPKVFECEGVKTPGYTADHFFLGPETPLGGGRAVSQGHIFDGPSKTIAVVQGGPETAVIWTKPSGLRFDPDNPKQVLGRVGKKILTIFCDGNVRVLDGDIDNETFSRLIQHADGKAVEQFPRE